MQNYEEVELYSFRQGQKIFLAPWLICMAVLQADGRYEKHFVFAQQGRDTFVTKCFTTREARQYYFITTQQWASNFHRKKKIFRAYKNFQNVTKKICLYFYYIFYYVDNIYAIKFFSIIAHFLYCILLIKSTRDVYCKLFRCNFQECELIIMLLMESN